MKGFDEQSSSLHLDADAMRRLAANPLPLPTIDVAACRSNSGFSFD